MGQTPRDCAREQTMSEIVRIGRAHLESTGAAALSLRAVARDLGVVSSAVYRYVKSRDELLTLLVVDGYQALGDAVDSAVDACSPEDFRAQFMALARGVRLWAVAEPARYGLLFGAPVPGYKAPAEQTVQPGTRVIYRMVHVIHGAYEAGQINTELGSLPLGGVLLPPSLEVNLAQIRQELGLTMGEQELVRGLLVWPALFGAVSFEVFGQYGPNTFADPAELFEAQCEFWADTLGL